MNSKRPTDIDSRVANRIRFHRTQRGMTQNELAERLGITFQQVQKYEKAVNRIGAGRLFELARIFDVPIQELYPEAEDEKKNDAPNAPDRKRAVDYAMSVDGWYLCRAFMQIDDGTVRKRLVALVQEIAENASSSRRPKGSG